MKISKLIFAIVTISLVSLTSCRDKKTETTEEHGHAHDADGNHKQDETVDQEEFIVTKDSLQTKEDTHSHDNGEGHNH